MSDDIQAPHQIERDIERHRAELSDSVKQIQERFAPEAILHDLTRNLRTQADGLGHAVSSSVRQNPVALAITGIGLAWLIFGRSYDERPEDGSTLPDGAAGDGFAAFSGEEWYGEPVEERSVRTSAASGGSRVPYPDWVEDDWDDDDMESSPSLGDRAARVAAEAATAGAALSDRAARFRDSLYHGTEQLGETARDRIAEARHTAIEARVKAKSAMRDGWRTGRDRTVHFVEDQPWVAGALALAAGAAIAAAIPRSRVEDNWLGAESDRLIDEADRILEEERLKARKMAKAALKEAGDITEEKVESAGKAASSAAKAASQEMRDAASRVKTAATDEAERQGSGESRS